MSVIGRCVDVREVLPSNVGCVHSRGHSFELILLKLCQSVNLNEIQNKFETGSCWIKN